MLVTGFVIHLSGKQNYYYEKELHSLLYWQADAVIVNGRWSFVESV